MEQDRVEGWVTESLQGVIERMFGLLITSDSRGPVWGEYQGSPTSTHTVVDQGVLQLQNVFNPLVLFLATLGILLAAVRLLWTRRLDPMIDLIRGLLTVIVATFGGLFLIYALSQFSSAFTSMILNTGTYRAPVETGTGQLMQRSFLHAAQEVYPSLIRVGVGGADLGFGDNEVSRGAVTSMIGLAVMLGVIAQMVVLTLLDAIIYLIACLLPLAAASAMIPNLKLFPKIIGWLFACLLYKPLLLMIYLSGLVILATANGYGTDSEDGLLRYLLGASIMLLATGALPVLMKLMSSGSMWAMAFLAGGVNSVTGGGGGGNGNSSGNSTSGDSASTNAQSSSSSADSGSANAQQAAAGANERAAGVSRNLDGGGTDAGGDAAAVTAASAAGTGTGAAGTSPLGTQGQFSGLDGGGTDGAADPAGGTDGAANPAGGAADGGASGATEAAGSTVSGSEQSSSQTVASGADDVAGGAGGGSASAGDGGGTAPGLDSPGGAVMVSDGGGGASDGGGPASGGGTGSSPSGAGSDSLADGADGRMV